MDASATTTGTPDLDRLGDEIAEPAAVPLPGFLVESEAWDDRVSSFRSRHTERKLHLLGFASPRAGRPTGRTDDSQPGAPHHAVRRRAVFPSDAPARPAGGRPRDDAREESVAGWKQP
jgi:hypothetical protein